MAAQIQLCPMVRSGGRKSRQEAIARARAGSLLMLCLESQRSPQSSEVPSHTVELAIVASKKQVSKRATERNRVKRRLRHAAQVLKEERSVESLQLDGDLKLKIIIVSHREMQQSPFEELQRQILVAFHRLLNELEKGKRL